MKTLKKIAICSTFVPMVALTAGTLSAQGQPGGSSTQSSQPNQQDDRRGTQSEDRRGTQPGQTGHQAGQTGTQTGQTGAQPGQTGSQTSNVASRIQDRADRNVDFMASAPGNAMSVDDVLGSNLYMRDGDEDIGTINDLLINESGEIVAVITSVGGFLGMGERNVAISWDSVDHRMNNDQDGYRFSINATEDDLRNAPQYDEDRMGARSLTN